MNEYLQDEREIKGYVEVEYSNIDNTFEVGSEYLFINQAPISDFTKIENKKVAQNYASLEQDYFLLDGSFVLPYMPSGETEYYNTNSGFISADTIEELIQPSMNYIPLYINNISKTIDGFTIYLKDNIPSDIELKFTNSNSEELTYTIEDNTKEVITIKFDEQQTITAIEMKFSNFEYNNRRFRMPKFDYGLSDILKDSKLISFNLVENIGELNLEFPSNQLTINIYDEEDNFDIMNPSGYASLLNESLKVKFKPYLGILTTNEGIKYEELATYYLKDWSNNNKNITLNCVDYLEKMKNIPYAPDVYGYDLTRSSLMGLDHDLETETNIKFDDFTNFEDSSGKGYLEVPYLDTMNVFDYLTNLLVYLWGYMYSDKDKIVVGKREENLVYEDTLTLDTNLLEEPIYTLKEKIKSITITEYMGTYINNPKQWQAAETIYLTNSERAYNNQPEIVDLGKYHDLHVEGRNVSGDIGVYKVLNASEWCPAVISPPTNITFYDLGEATFSTETFIKQVNDSGKEITIDNKLFKLSDDETKYGIVEVCDNLCNKIIDDYKTYDISIKYVGDPNIKPNMILPIETQYGEKQIKVLKHTLTFNGGLTGTIEGVGD